ncbi:MAG: GNAT family N-acetyltransferase [Chthonomonadaceae bacterium]|nr:GNAT family N-acetyltransferase [Chthonomonadaceae bacterium]
MQPNQLIQTERLVLRASHPDLAQHCVKFYLINQEHLAPWNPVLSRELFTEEGQQVRLAQAHGAFLAGTSWRWHLLDPSQTEMLGVVQYSQIHRGGFQSAMLGYSLAKSAEGKGMMAESLSATIAEVFSERGRLHRIQANVVPANTRSLNLLVRLGFVNEGLAKNYLYIDGQWRDHVMHSLINPDFDVSWLGF